ncbi:MAG: hypothetical protein AVDCRST_MAG89-2933, partial [uncultured Gemmatimonadetes bacterium]
DGRRARGHGHAGPPGRDRPGGDRRHVPRESRAAGALRRAGARQVPAGHALQPGAPGPRGGAGRSRLLRAVRRLVRRPAALPRRAHPRPGPLAGVDGRRAARPAGAGRGRCRRGESPGGAGGAAPPGGGV